MPEAVIYQIIKQLAKALGIDYGTKRTCNDQLLMNYRLKHLV